MTEWRLEQFLELAKTAAQQAGELLSNRPDHLEVEGKSTPTDAVTQMDWAAERLLVDVLLGQRPEDGVLGEEGSDRDGTTGYRWVIDPLDGTVNYLYGLPGWAVCVGLEYQGVPVVGAVAIPTWQSLFFGATGLGSYQQVVGKAPKRLAVGEVSELSLALTGTGFGYAPERRRAQGVVVAEMLPKVRDIRRAGSAAVDLCSVAAGYLDAYYEKGLNPWDFTAGAVIAREAGAVVAGIDTDTPNSALTLAANPTVFGQLHDALKELNAHQLDELP